MTDIKLTEDQQKASSLFTDFLLNDDEKYMVIQGAAGTGKSTLVRHLLDTVNARLKLYSILLGNDTEKGYTIELTATTNKAASVLSEMTGSPCSTIHSCLGLVPRQNWNTGEVNFVPNPKKKGVLIFNTLLVVDEASFISDELFGYIDKATIDSKVLLIGDQYQLAPVNQTIPIMDKLQCCKATLDKIMRHGGNIAKAGAQYRETVKTGVFSPIMVDGRNIIHVDGPTFKNMIDAEFTHTGYDETKARVLAWVNETVNMYNTYIRCIRGGSSQFEVGDVVVTNKPIIVNNTNVAATEESVSIVDIGRDDEQYGVAGRWVTLCSGYSFFLPNDPTQASKCIKSFKRLKDWETYFRLQNDWLDLRPAFASTVHKSQGSTFDTVYINLTDIGRCRIPSDVARMLYVAVTRAAKRVVLNGALPPIYQGVFNANQTVNT